ncbi:MAG: arylesterase [Deltaproteobacteria bacterium]|nr:arylesterase [Deltaproteobacteria bacterium]
MKTNILIFLIFSIFGLSQSILAETKILFLGDSLTAGYGIEKFQAFPTLIDKKLKEKGYKNIKVINGGISGSTSASALSRLKWYLKIKPDIMILALGANDGLRGLSVSELRKNLTACIQLAKENNIIIVLAGMRMPPNYGAAYTKSFFQIFGEVSKEQNVPLIPFLLKDVAGIPDLNIPDGIHPKEAGHKIVAQTVLPYIIKLL